MRRVRQINFFLPFKWLVSIFPINWAIPSVRSKLGSKIVINYSNRHNNRFCWEIMATAHLAIKTALCKWTKWKQSVHRSRYFTERWILLQFIFSILSFYTKMKTEVKKSWNDDEKELSESEKKYNSLRDNSLPISLSLFVLLTVKWNVLKNWRKKTYSEMFWCSYA